MVLVVLGVVSYQRLAIDEYPDVTYPVVIVSTTFPGASPESMMRDVSKPIEEALNTVQGIKEISSTSLEGSSIVRLKFHLGVDVATAQQDVQAKVARIRRSLPPDIDEPVIRHFDPNDSPIMSIAIQSDERSIRELTDLADEVIATRLEAIAGVGGVNLVGGNTRQIRVQLDPDAMRAYGVSPRRSRPRCSARTRKCRRAACSAETRSSSCASPAASSIRRPSATSSCPSAAGVPVRLRDVATVVDGAEERRSGAEINDVTAVSLEVLKISGANTVAGRRLRSRCRRERASVAAQRTSSCASSATTHNAFASRCADVQLTILLGAILTIAIIYLFLNSWRSTVITGLTLPVSIISAFFIMWVFDFTINTMTLLALSLAIGLLIDDAIVVRENIVRHLEMGKDHHRAAKEGTDEIGLAVISTTLAVVAVFVPVAFMGGMIGKIFFQFGVTVAFAVLVSLFVSFTLDPMLSSVWADPEVERRARSRRGRRKTRSGASVLRFNDWFERVADRYPRWLHWALTHRATVIGGALASIVIAAADPPAARLHLDARRSTATSSPSASARRPGRASSTRSDKGREIARLPASSSRRSSSRTCRSAAASAARPTTGTSSSSCIPRHAAQTQPVRDPEGSARQAPADPGGPANIQGQQSIFGGVGNRSTSTCRGRSRRVSRSPRHGCSRRCAEFPASPSPPRATRARFRSSTCASTGSRRGGWPRHRQHRHDASAPLLRPARHAVGGSAMATRTTSSSCTRTRCARPPRTSPSIPVASSSNDPRTGSQRSSRCRRSPTSGPASARSRSSGACSSGRSRSRPACCPAQALGDVADRAKRAIAEIGLPPGYHAVFGGDVQNLGRRRATCSRRFSSRSCSST